MRRHLALWGAFIKNCLIREMSFRVNFFVNLVTGSMWFLMNVLFFTVIYGHTDQIAGWGKYEVYFLIGTSHVIMRIFMTFFMFNLSQMPEKIRTGEMDFYLAKPVNTQFFVSTRNVNFDSITDSLVGFALMAFAWAHMAVTVTAYSVAAFAILVVSGVMAYYTIMFVFVTLSFWFTRFNPMEVWWSMTNIARQPADIFTGKLQFFLTFCLPLLMIVNFPVKTLLFKLPVAMACYGLAINAAFFLVASWFFTVALRRYRSASS